MAAPTIPVTAIGALMNMPRGDGGDTGGLTGRSRGPTERVEDTGGGGGGACRIRLAVFAEIYQGTSHNSSR